MKKHDYKKLIQNEKNLLDNFNNKLSTYCLFNDFEKHQLIVCIIEKIVLIHEKIEQKVSDLIPLNSYLRFILETLIQTELLLKEEEYKFKLFYSVYNHQVTKSEKFVERLRKEINLMKKLGKEDDEILKNVVFKGIEEGETPDIIIEKHELEKEKLDNIIEQEFTIFSVDYKNLGYNYSVQLMETNLLPLYEAKTEEKIELRIKKAKELVKDPRLTKHFDFKGQHSKVFKLLKDERSWEEKAVKVGLQDEYKLIYDITSSVLHSTSYSLITNNEPNENEIDLCEELIYKYSDKIIKNCLELADSNFYDKFLVLNITEEE